MQAQGQKSTGNDLCYLCQVTAEVAWKRLCKIGFDGLDALCERLAQLEGVGNEDEECLKLLDLDAMMEIQREIIVRT